MTLEIAKYIDHTLLSPQATMAEITQLCEEAKEWRFFAVCVNPYYVKQAVRELSTSNVVVDTVVGFPLGANLADVKIAEAQRAIFEGAEEIDMVINIAALKNGDIDYVKDEIEAIVKVAKEHVVKVIIECDLLNEHEKETAARACIQGGAHFVKTSTGFVKDSPGASIEDVRRLRDILSGSNVGIKAAGGIRDYEKAQALIAAGATRLGTSAGVAIVKQSQVAHAVS